jgi:hypothetical protein
MANSDEKKVLSTERAYGTLSPGAERMSDDIPERLVVLARQLQLKLDELHGPNVADGERDTG